jgi:hypothetical protein
VTKVRKNPERRISVLKEKVGREGGTVEIWQGNVVTSE